MNMSNRKSLELNLSIDDGQTDSAIRELFEACKTGDLAKVKKFTNQATVNARDVSGRKSTALHFASGKFALKTFFCCFFVMRLV